MSSSLYNQEWSATCPRCEKSVTPDLVKCSNCGKGRILTKAKTRDDDALQFRCDYCDSTTALSCPDCSASIADKFVQVYRNEKTEISEKARENELKKDIEKDEHIKTELVAKEKALLEKWKPLERLSLSPTVRCKFEIRTGTTGENKKHYSGSGKTASGHWVKECAGDNGYFGQSENFSIFIPDAIVPTKAERHERDDLLRISEGKNVAVLWVTAEGSQINHKLLKIIDRDTHKILHETYSGKASFVFSMMLLAVISTFLINMAGGESFLSNGSIHSVLFSRLMIFLIIFLILLVLMSRIPRVRRLKQHVEKIGDFMKQL